MKHFNALCFVMVLCLSMHTILAQNRWIAEFRPGIDFSTEDMGNTKLKTGFGFEIVLSCKIMQHLTTYACWWFNTFQSDTDLEINFDA